MRQRRELPDEAISDKIASAQFMTMTTSSRRQRVTLMASRKSSTGSKRKVQRPPREKLLWMYRTMMRIRRFEEAAEDAFRNARMRGALHFYIGEEATATGVCADLRTDDYITSTHRGHGHCIAKGGQLNKMMAELFGRVTGYCGGKGGSMHIADLDIGILGANGIVGAGIPIAAGAGLGVKLSGEDGVVVCFFGDGAGPTGAFHEGVNFAAVKDLPVIFVCENNHYGMATTSANSNAGPSIAARAVAYGIHGASVDGNDVFAVHAVALEAIDRARNGGGPTLIEADTYRFKGHTVHDMAAYRAKKELEEWLKKDPIERFKKTVSTEKLLDAEDMTGIDSEVEREVADAVEFAEASPYPELDSIEQGVYAD